MRQKKESILKSKLSDEPVYTLGVYSSYNEELGTKKT